MIKRSISIVMAGAAISLLMTAAALANMKVYSPIVEGHELEFEFSGLVDTDRRDSKNNLQECQYSVGYGVTDRWATELYGETSKAADDNNPIFDSVEWENRYQLFEQGKYWLDAGLYFSYETTVEAKTADKLEGKILLEKSLGRFLHTANIIFEKEVGGGSHEQTAGGLAWSSRYHWHEMFEPGIELHSDFGELKQRLGFKEQSHLLGPVFYGKLGSHVKYDVGYLFGLTDPAPQGEIKWTLEYEQPF